MKMVDESSVSVLRPLTCEMGSLSRCDGSGTLFQGDTCVLTCVYGPTEVRINKEQLDKATVEVVYKPKSGLPGCSDKAYEKLIRNTCEAVLLTGLHPRSSISIIIQEVQNSGSYMATCINSACLALLDASVSMKCMLAAVGCSITSEGDIIVDPDRKQEESSESTLMFIFDSKDKNVITVSAEGKYTTEQFQKCLYMCQQAASQVFEFYRDSIKRKMAKSL